MDPSKFYEAFFVGVAAQAVHFMPLAAAALQQSLAAVPEAQHEAHWVQAQLDRKKAPVAARRRVMIFMVLIR